MNIPLRIKKTRRKAGFGLVEALVAMVILALLFTGVMVMNYSNHRAALRIATRNQAIQVGQRVLDSLQVLGLVMVNNDSGEIVGDTLRTLKGSFCYRYRWRADVDTMLTTVGSEELGPEKLKSTSVRAKKVDLQVRWTLDNHENTISLSTVVE